MLPKWLAEPDMIEKDIKSNLIPFNEVPGICPLLRKRLEANGIHNFFPGQRVYLRVHDSLCMFMFVSHQSFAFLKKKNLVQAEVIPAVLESVNSGFLIGRGGYRPRDICVSAPTGSGKTLTFVIPVVQVRYSVHENSEVFVTLVILYIIQSS